jgi:putative DNA primase/helicase
VFNILAIISCGGKWPDGTRAPLGDVLIWSGEDDIEDTILPRFVVAGGDPKRIYFIDDVIQNGARRHFDPATDMPSLLAAAKEIPNLTAVAIDPIVSASAGDSHKNAETRRGLQPVVDLATKANSALIGVTHFTKGTQGRDPIERITGTLAYGAIPRVVLGAAKNDEDEGAPRRLVRIASNIGNSGGGFEYLLRQELLPEHDFTAQRVIWGDRLTGSAKELLEDTETGGGELLKAIGFIEQLLAGAGRDGMAVNDIRAAATANGFAWRTVTRAKEKSGAVKAVKGTTWSWVMQSTADSDVPF